MVSCTSDSVIRPPVELPEDRNDVPLELRPVDEQEEDKIKRFVEIGCGCQSNSELNCSSLFSLSHYREIRNSCAELDHDSLDLVVMGQLMALTTNSTTVTDKNDQAQERQRQSTVYMHLGQKVKK